MLAVLEDAHWIDPTSLDLFSRLVEGLQRLRALLVVTFRPEFAAPGSAAPMSRRSRSIASGGVKPWR